MEASLIEPELDCGLKDFAVFDMFTRSNFFLFGLASALKIGCLYSHQLSIQKRVRLPVVGVIKAGHHTPHAARRTPHALRH